MYKKFVSSDTKGSVEAKDFLMDAKEELYKIHESKSSVPSNEKIRHFVGKALACRPLSFQKGKVEQDRYWGDNVLDDLAARIKSIFISEYNLMRSKRIHEATEGHYILRAGKISSAFQEIGSGYKRNLLNNRILLALHNINAQEYVAPQASPK